MTQNPPSDQAERAERVAQAFGVWSALLRRLESEGDRSGVSLEAISKAWDALEQAHEEWSLGQ